MRPRFRRRRRLRLRLLLLHLHLRRRPILHLRRRRPAASSRECSGCDSEPRSGRSGRGTARLDAFAVLNRSESVALLGRARDLAQSSGAASRSSSWLGAGNEPGAGRRRRLTGLDDEHQILVDETRRDHAKGVVCSERDPPGSASLQVRRPLGRGPAVSNRSLTASRISPPGRSGRARKIDGSSFVSESRSARSTPTRERTRPRRLERRAPRTP